MHAITLSSASIGTDHPPFIIAEMSGNHNQSLERALEIVDAAADAGAHALKLQTYTPDTMTLDLEDGDFFLANPESLWKGQSLYQLYGQAFTPWEWHAPIFQRCRERGIIGFSTPFDATAVDFLEALDAPLYKIASFENTDLPLIRRVAQTGKPMIISTGMATLADLDETVRAARDAGCRELILLKCTSTYPASPSNSNLLTIPHLAELFDVQVGLSDHTLGIGAALAGIALGATVVEKHLTLSRAEGGVDAAFSLEPNELQALVTESMRAWQALGKVHYGPLSAEAGSMQFRRSLYVAEDMKAGEAFTERNLRAIRPGYGLPTKYLPLLLGKRVKHDVKKGTRVQWELLVD